MAIFKSLPVLLLFGSLAPSVQAQTCADTPAACEAGCYNDGGSCVPVGQGYYSPANNSSRFECGEGEFSNTFMAESCTECSPGSFNIFTGQADCITCPPNSYQDMYGQRVCLGCTPGYAGEGANAFIIVNETEKICVLETPEPSASPSSIPSMVPSGSPSSMPSLLPSASPSQLPSMVPSDGPSLAPSLTPSETPSLNPSLAPTMTASDSPSLMPSLVPSLTPSTSPSLTPSASPSASPSLMPSSSPSFRPSLAPSQSPSMSPTVTASMRPSQAPSDSPSTGVPSLRPSTSTSPSLVSENNLEFSPQVTRNGPSTGALVGILVVAIASTAFIVALIFFYVRRQEDEEEEEEEEETDSDDNNMTLDSGKGGVAVGGVAGLIYDDEDSKSFDYADRKSNYASNVASNDATAKKGAMYSEQELVLEAQPMAHATVVTNVTDSYTEAHGVH